MPKVSIKYVQELVKRNAQERKAQEAAAREAILKLLNTPTKTDPPLKVEDLKNSYGITIVLQGKGKASEDLKILRDQKNHELYAYLEDFFKKLEVELAHQYKTNTPHSLLTLIKETSQMLSDFETSQNRFLCIKNWQKTCEQLLPQNYELLTEFKATVANIYHTLLPLVRLRKKINAIINDPTQKNKPNFQSFCDTLEDVYKKLDKEITAKSSLSITAEEMVEDTLTLLNGIQKANTNEKKLAALINYENKYKKMLLNTKFIKVLTKFCFAALGFIVGAAIGCGIGGSIAGPAGAGLGLVGGGIAGAWLGALAAHGDTKLKTKISNRLLLFKPAELCDQPLELAKISRLYFKL